MKKNLIALSLLLFLALTSCEARKEGTEDNSQNSSTNTEAGENMDNEAGSIDESETAADTSTIDQRNSQ